MILLGSSIFAEYTRTTLLSEEFSNNKELKGWTDLWSNNNRAYPKKDYFTVITGSGETYFHIAGTLGVTRKLDKPVIIDEALVEIDFQVTLRKKNPDSAALLHIALTSLLLPSNTDGGPFFKNCDGFEAAGYQYDNQNNFIAAISNGRCVQMPPPVQPFNLLVDTSKWYVWRLVYNNVEKTLSFYRDFAKDKNPCIVQHEVNLQGGTINSVWLGAFGIDYSKVTVSVERK